MKFLTRSSFANDAEYLTYNKVSRRLLPFLLLLYIISFLDRVNVGFAKLQMSSEIGLSDAAFGLGAGIFFIGYALFEIPSNLLLQRFGAKFWIARILVVWGIISTAMCLVESPTSFLVLRFLLGIAEAGFYPGVILYLTYWYPLRLRSQVCSIFFLGVPLSGLIGGPLSGWIMHSLDGVWGHSGWQWMFVLEGGPAILAGIFTYFYLDNGPRAAKWLSAEERELVASTLDKETALQLRAGHGHKFMDAIRNGNVWQLAAANFTLLSSIYGVSFWMPQIVKDLGVTNVLSNGLLTAVPFGIAAIGMVLVGQHSDKTGERRWHMIWCTLVAAAGMLISGANAGSPVLSLIGLSMAATGALAGIAVMWALPGAILTGAAAAAGIALMATIGNLGGYLAPYMMGLVKQRTAHLEYGLYTMAISLLVGAIIIYFLPKTVAANKGVPSARKSAA
ncbi:MFS transporter [Cupriavidus basilensis]|uniref:MFS transporter n=1 Tax=Cupriavidus basilensis TaxID=68895 RepID=UPI0023E76D51|nr:MFS transporter [Cupriavidus basilensis]MDF3883012.1 MFS transporter [Cupriavidus basilensis]